MTAMTFLTQFLDEDSWNIVFSFLSYDDRKNLAIFAEIMHQRFLATVPAFSPSMRCFSASRASSSIYKYLDSETEDEKDITSEEEKDEGDESWHWEDAQAEAARAEAEEDEELAEQVKRLEERDSSLSRTEINKMRKERDDIVDIWLVEFFERRMKHVSAATRDLAIACGPLVKKAMMMASKGSLKLLHGRLNKAFKFRSGLRDLFLASPAGTLRYSESTQYLDLALAILLHHCHSNVFNAFVKLAKGDTDPFALADVLPGLVSARGQPVDGIYVRFVPAATAARASLRPNFGVYVGLANNLNRRQVAHDASDGVNHLLRAAHNKVPPKSWSASILVDFGPSNMSEMPPPIAHAIETILIAMLNALDCPNPVQVRLFDLRGYNPRDLKQDPEEALLAACVEAWDTLFDLFHKRQDARPILPPRTVLSHVMWTRRLAPVLARYSSVTTRTAVSVLFCNPEFDYTLTETRLRTVHSLRSHQAAKPLPESAFAIPSLDSRYASAGNAGGERLTIARTNRQRPFLPSSYDPLERALTSAMSQFDAYIDQTH